MVQPRDPAATSPVLVALGMLLVVAIVGGAMWELKHNHDRAQIDLKRTLGICAAVGDVGLCRRQHGYLPRRLADTGPPVTVKDCGPVGHRLVDAYHFQLGTRFLSGSSGTDGSGLGEAWKHPAGYAWFTFDARKLDDPATHGVPDPDAVEPGSED